MPGPEPGPARTEAAGVYPRTFGKYTLLRHLAIGGMADVFLAHQKGLAGFEKDCVIKRILPHLAQDAEFVQMFLDEARIVARLSHPNIVQIFDLGQVDADYFLAMEYVDGVNLEHLLEQVAARAKSDKSRAADVGVPWPLAVRIASEVAAGLDHAHNARDSAGRALGLVHRDISTSNVMLSYSGVAKILDFGIAKAVQGNIKRSKTEVGTVKGKVPYMSPEQLQGLALDGRSDLFSLGVILYELVCGVRPFPAETAGPLTVQILQEPPVPPPRLGADFPPGLWAIVQRALAKQPAGRFQSARDLKLALEQLLAVQHASCSAYDVEAYLRDLFPEDAPRSLSGERHVDPGGPTAAHPASGPAPQAALPPGAEAARIAASAAPERPAPEQPTSEVNPGMDADERRMRGSGPQGPVGPIGGHAGLDALLEEESRPRRRKGGGLVMAAIGALVLATIAGLFVLRQRFMKDPGAETSGRPEAGKTPETPVKPTPAEPTKPAEPAKTPEAATKPAEPAKAPEVKKPEAPTKPEPTKAPEVKKAEPHKPEKKPEAPHKPRVEKKSDESEPVKLPRLPTPPPTEGE